MFENAHCEMIQRAGIKKRYAFILFLVLAVNMVGVCELNSRANRRQISHFSFLTGLKKKTGAFQQKL